MALSFEVNAAALISWGGSPLGYTTDGAELTINPEYEEVMCDSFGTRVPAELQSMLGRARCDLDIVFFDNSVLGTALLIGGAALGTMPAAGTLMGAGGFLKALVIGGNAGFTFPNSYLVSGGPIRKGTRKTTNRLSFSAIPFSSSGLTSGSSAGAVLFTRP